MFTRRGIIISLASLFGLGTLSFLNKNPESQNTDDAFFCATTIKQAQEAMDVRFTRQDELPKDELFPTYRPEINTNPIKITTPRLTRSRGFKDVTLDYPTPERLASAYNAAIQFSSRNTGGRTSVEEIDRQARLLSNSIPLQLHNMPIKNMDFAVNTYVAKVLKCTWKYDQFPPSSP